MQSILEDIRTEAEKLWQAGILEAETILRKAEEAIGMHKAATAAAPCIPGIEVTEGTPLADGGYPPINQVADECATPAAEVLASPTADAAPAAEAATAASDPTPAAPAP